jgi:serine phosphatase RsbU (regulator of sigma subunit)
VKIRTKLALAFVVLAVLPLAAIVFVNYLSTIRIFRQAVETEVRGEARELNDRMAEARNQLGRRLRALGSISLGTLAAGTLPESAAEVAIGRSLEDLGELAPLVESVEVIPLEAPRPAPPTAATPPTPAIAPVPAPEAPAAPAPPGLDEEARAGLEGTGLPSSFVIYLDSLVEAARALEDDPEALEQEALVATEGFMGELGQAMGQRAEQLAARAQAVDEEIAVNERQVEALSGVLQNPSLSTERRTELNAERRRAAESLRRAAREKRRLEQEEIEALQEGWEQAKSLLGHSFDWRIHQDGKVVGEVRAQISPEHLLASILGPARRDQGEVPFAVGPDGTLYTSEPADRERIGDLSLETVAPEGGRPYIGLRQGWLVVANNDPESEVTLGIARPIGESLAAMQRNAVRNFGLGLGAIVFAMIGILPLSRRMTHNLSELSSSVDRLAAGESSVQVDIRSRDEIGQLAHAFNRMASDLHQQRERLIDEVRRREEQETRQRLLAAENERKSRELEDARAFQLSLLPAELPEHPDLALAVHMQTATEVGGDYYDFLSGEDGSLTLAVGDATGHGARAGTMVTALKSLFMASAHETRPADFLARSSEAIKRMNLGRMTMALGLVRYREGRVLAASAGMPPPLVWRAATGEVEEIELTGLPLGGLANTDYQQAERALAQGDVLLMMSDGFPELANPRGEPLGYPAAKRIFQRLGARAPKDILHGLEEAGAEWRAGRPLLDDVTFVVVQLKGRTR